jgi:Ca-activated chloride channel family protein
MRFLFLVLTLSALAEGNSSEQSQVKLKTAIVADVELVQIPVIVFNDKGMVATDLQKDDFRLVEDGIEQRLLYCDKERESVSLVILGDVSQSMTRKIQFVQEATESILEALPPDSRYQDEYSVFGIENQAVQLVPFTKDQQSIVRRLSALLASTNGATALFDGIYAGALAADREAENSRRAVIIISDGGDNHSRHNLRQTKRFLEEVGLPVFAVMAGHEFEELPPPETPPRLRGIPIPIPMPDVDFVGPAERRGPQDLRTLTEVTGGGVFTAHDPEGLDRIVRTISLAVRYQYVLSYQTLGTEQIKTQNNWHGIRLELIPSGKFKGYSIYYKRGYYRNSRELTSRGNLK